MTTLDQHRQILAVLQDQGPMTTTDIVYAIRGKTADDVSSTRRWVMEAMVIMVAKGAITGPDPHGRYAAVPYTPARPQIPLDAALPVAEQLVRDLGGLCDRLEIAGSIRRRKPLVGDIELCALVPAETDLLGEPASDQREPAIVAALRARASMTTKAGRKYAQVVLDEPPIGAVKVDLFLTADPECWGRLFFLRTGSADFVMRADDYFGERSGGTITDLRYHASDGCPLHTPEEDDVFRLALGIAPVAPERRLPRP